MCFKNVINIKYSSKISHHDTLHLSMQYTHQTLFSQERIPRMGNPVGRINIPLNNTCYLVLEKIIKAHLEGYPLRRRPQTVNFRNFSEPYCT